MMSQKSIKEYHSPFPDVHLPSTSLLNLLFSNPNKAAPDKPIFIDAINPSKFHTFSQITHQTKCLVTGLQTLGVKPGDVVSTFSPNTIDYPIQVYAILGCGAIVSPANYAYTTGELHAQLNTSGAKYLIAHSSLLPIAESAIKGTQVTRLIQSDGTRDKHSHPTAVLMARTYPPGDLHAVSSPQEALAFLCFSSGTTGAAKGVMTTHHNMTSNIAQWRTHLPADFTGNSPTVAFVPFSHMYGLAYFLCKSMITGTPVAVMSAFNLPVFLSTVAKYRCEVLSLVPPVVLLLVKDPSLAKYDLSSVKRMFSAAAPLSIELGEAVESRFKSLYGTEVHCFQAWGLTETSPLATAVPTDRTDKKHTVGCIAPNMKFRLVDPETLLDIEDPTTQSGEIWCRGPNVTPGYYRNPAATSSGFSEVDGTKWFRTGDICTMDRDGYFQIVDRIKEMIKYKGLQVVPSELEGKLLQHPDVEDACVVGVWVEELATEVPLGFVVLSAAGKENGEKESVEGIHTWLNERVAGHKRLRGGIRVIDAVPKSASGKILRRTLRDGVAKEMQGGLKIGARL
jgi:acyl-CoA synthetase (AMP-forming)/AMP-acid ligase II